jgi:hypothetical protein
MVVGRRACKPHLISPKRENKHNNMLNNVFFFVALLFVISCKEKLESKIVLFEDVELSNGEYKLYFFGLESDGIKGFSNFYIDDKETLSKIKAQWIFDEKSETMSCGYSYSMVLVINKKIVLQKAINTECEYLEGWIHFPNSYLTSHKMNFKKLSEKEAVHFKNTHAIFY